MTDGKNPFEDYLEAQEQEARAYEAGYTMQSRPVAEAKTAQARALNELEEANAASLEEEETVTLKVPNPRLNATDANGVRLKAEGVPRSLAEKYAADFEHYRITEEA